MHITHKQITPLRHFREIQTILHIITFVKQIGMKLDKLTFPCLQLMMLWLCLQGMYGAIAPVFHWSHSLGLVSHMPYIFPIFLVKTSGVAIRRIVD